MKKYLLIVLIPLLFLGCQDFKEQDDVELLLDGISQVVSKIGPDVARAIGDNPLLDETIEFDLDEHVSGKLKIYADADASLESLSFKGVLKSELLLTFKQYTTGITKGDEKFAFGLNGKLAITTETRTGFSAADLLSLKGDFYNKMQIKNKGLLVYNLELESIEQIVYSTPLSINIMSEVKASSGFDVGSGFNSTFKGKINGHRFNEDDKYNIKISVPYHTK